MTIAQRTSIAERTAQTIWTGRLASGSGTVTSGSGALDGLPVTWASRIEHPSRLFAGAAITVDAILDGT
jgi:X-X-X-Leu-X-X-Gly heptad repeat protein